MQYLCLCLFTTTRLIRASEIDRIPLGCDVRRTDNMMGCDTHTASAAESKIASVANWHQTKIQKQNKVHTNP